MRILTYDELPLELDPERALIHLAALSATASRRRIALDRDRLKRTADYVGLFAVEDGHILGHLYVLRIPYTFPDGPGTVSGIASVGTRPDRARTGVARILLSEAHLREREAGIEHCTLWTNRSWGAHALYEKLGYRDIYSSPWAVHIPFPAQRPHPPNPGVRAGLPSDLDEIDRFHDRQAEGRVGFCLRPKGFLRAQVQAERLDPAINLLVARDGRKLVGYALLDRTPQRVTCGEMATTTRVVQRALIEAVGHVANGVPFAFQHTPVTDTPGLFHGAGFSNLSLGWYVFMGLTHGHEQTVTEAEQEFVTDDSRFICLAGDRF